jgi:hypothetical protein
MAAIIRRSLRYGIRYKINEMTNIKTSVIQSILNRYRGRCISHHTLRYGIKSYCFFVKNNSEAALFFKMNQLRLPNKYVAVAPVTRTA